MPSIHPEAAAAVAIICSTSPIESVLILRRAAHPNDPWSGHFSFPGGRRDPLDHDLLATCLRETAEETGIVLTRHQLERSLAVQPAGRELPQPLWVQPFLFTLEEQPPLSLNPREIRSGHWLLAHHFLDRERHRQVEMVPGRLYPTYPMEDYYLWGFTYRLLRAVLAMPAG